MIQKRMHNKLSKAAEYEARRIGNRVQERYLCRGRIPKENDYPAVAAACSSFFIPIIYLDHSRGARTQHIQKQLLKALLKIGPINTKIKGCGNYIGHCAEQHAANKLLQEQKHSTVNDIFFGNAYRPRTGEYIPVCEICKDVFPTLNDK